MHELSALGLTSAQEDEWRDFFGSGRVFVAPLDRTAVRRRLRVNAVVIGVAGVVLLSTVVTFFAVLFLHIGGPVTVLLLALLTIAAIVLLVRFVLLRRRLRAGRASTDDFLVVSAEGIRLAGHVDLPWTAVIGGVGFDERGAALPLLRGPAAAIERSAGRVQSEFVLGVRGVRALRDAAPRDLHGIFEVIGAHGGIRVPVDTMVAAENVRAALAAICIAGVRSAVDVEVTSDRSTIYTRTLALLGPEKPAPSGQG
ncbi:hypothetical protein ACTJKH_17040 [Microbacterium sp. 22215]|uniref:hypothetical protein n=1 Tax=Microbacterium sp. 22215 TaxID=3453893 RepID=UPI003F85D128